MQLPRPGGFSERLHFLFVTVAALLLSPALLAQDPPPPPEPAPQVQKPAPKNDMPRQRERWFYKQRAPQGVFPANARLKALQRVDEMRKAERARAGDAHLAPSEQFAIAASTSQWTPIGPRPADSVSSVGVVAGRTAAIAVNPLNQDEVYVGGAQGGVWRSMDGGATWNPLTDFEASLAMGAIAVDSASCSAAPGPPCQIIYAGTGEHVFSFDSYYGAGLLKSTNGGASWTQISSPFLGPNQTPLSSVAGGGRFSSLAIHPTNPNILLAGVVLLRNFLNGASSGVYRSVDAGITWNQVATASGAPGTEVLFDPANPNTAYAALGKDSFDADNGIYKSTDSGATFTKLTTLPAVVTSSNMGRIEITIGQPDPGQSEGVLYASIADASNSSNHLLGVFRSANGGLSWIQLGASNPLLTASAAATPVTTCSSQCWYDHVIRVHPNNPNVVYLGGAATGSSSGNYLLRTIDGGVNWTGVAIGSAGNRLHVDIQSMGFGFTGSQATRLFVGNDGGVWRADVSNPTGSLDWVNLNQDLQMIQFYPGLSFHPTDSNTTFGGSQDNGTLKFNGNLLWTDVTCGDGSWTAVDASNPSLPSIVYAACQFIDIRKSTNGGTSFNQANTGLPSNNTEDSNFIPPLVLDSANPQRLYFGTCRVWQTMNGASSWTAISNDLSVTSGAASCPVNTVSGLITALAVAPSEANTVYAGTDNGKIWRTTQANLGAGALNLWTEITGSGLPAREITWIAVHPTNPSIVFISFSGFSRPPGGDTTLFPDTLGHIFRATVSGAGTTWTDISGVLPNTPVNVSVIDPANTDTVYLGTDVGVFFATDANVGSPGWTTLVTGLPKVAVLGLALHSPSRTLRAATHGRGMWDLIVPLNPSFAVSNISPSTAIAGSAGFTLTVDGIGFSPTSVVRWNGQDRTPNLTQSATQLTVNIPATDISVAAFPNGGVATVTVFDPAQSPSLTNSRSFTISPPPPPNDDFANAIVASTNPFTNTVDNTNATNEAGEQFPSLACVGGIAGSGRNKTVWYRFTTATSVTVNVDTAGTNYDSVLSVWTGAALGALVEFACDDDGVAAGGASRLNNLVLPPGTYHFMVAGYSSTDSGTTVFNLSIPLADLSVTLSDTPDPVNAGSNLTYTALISNAGPTAASGVTLNHTVPANTTFVSHGSTAGSCSQAGGAVTCAIGSLNAGASATVTIVVTPGSAAVGSPLNATVTVSSATPDPSSGNNSASTTTAVVQPPDISLSANPTTITVTHGQSGTSTITVTALGGFSAAVALTCSGLPSLSACSFTPASITPTAQPATSTMTITTTAGAMLVPRSPLGPQAPVTKYRLWPILLALLGLAALLAPAARQNRKLRPAFALVTSVLLAGLFVACGGGGGGTPTPTPGTPRGTFTVTVTGTSGTISRTTTVTLTVN